MSKFRNKKTKLTVNGKLPFLTLFPTLANLDNFSYEYGEAMEVKKILSFTKKVGNVEDEGLRVFVSIVNSNDSRCEIVENSKGLGLVVSTKALALVARQLMESDINQGRTYSRELAHFDTLRNSEKVIKLVDIIRGVREMNVPVIECEIKYSENVWRRYFQVRGYSSKSCHIDPTLTNGCSPFISKRYEKHSFFAMCKKAFSYIRDEADRTRWGKTLTKWEMDLNYFKNHTMPKAFVEQEMILIEKELANG
jgi:hypothetical protein